MTKLFCAAFAALAAGAAATANASMTLASDSAFQALESSGQFTKTFAGNVRWGNGGPSGDWEYAIVNASDAPIGAVGQTPWAGSNTHTLTFSYAAGFSTLSLTGIGSITRAVPTGPTVIWSRVLDSETPFSSLSNIAIDLAYNGVGVDYSFASLVGDANAEYWGVSDANLAQGFTLTAIATLSGPRTSGSNPMYQFKVGVPTPGALALLGLGGLVVARRRR
jgi:hypothetical protein